MNPIQQWRADRRVAQEQAVIRAIGMLRPSQAGGYPIHRLAHIGVGQTYVVLARLEGAGRITSEWADMEPPRRRVYRVVRAEVAR